MKYFLNFVEEMVLNPDYYGYVGGRVEVYRKEDHFARMELQFFTKDADAFYGFRNKYDFKQVDIHLYRKFRRELRKFQEDINGN